MTQHDWLQVLGLICFGLVCAGLGAVVGALTNTTKKDRAMNGALEEIKAALEAANAKIDQQGAAIINIRTGLTKVGNETEGLKSEVARLNDLLGQEQPDLSEIKALALSLAEKVGAQGEALTAVEGDIAAIDAKVPDAPTPETPETPAGN